MTVLVTTPVTSLVIASITVAGDNSSDGSDDSPTENRVIPPVTVLERSIVSVPVTASVTVLVTASVIVLMTTPLTVLAKLPVTVPFTIPNHIIDP